MGLQRLGHDLVAKQQQKILKKPNPEKPQKDFNKKEMYWSRHWESRGSVLAFMTQMMRPGLSASSPAHHQEEAGSRALSPLFFPDRP